jgi:uncharacterized SAM-binding protein YcdF (DUF218 family)
MTFQRRLLVRVGVLLLALGLLWTIHPPLLRATRQWLDVGQQPRRAEYVMVLTGDETTRPFVAAVLAKAKLAPHVLITEVAQTPQEIDSAAMPYHELNCQVLMKRGLARSDITILQPAAKTTYDEARALAGFLRDRPHARVLVVTNDYHTRRSRWIFGRVLGPRAAQLSFVSAPSDGFRGDYWWQDEAGFVTILTEYLKLAFYVVYYGYVGDWLAACGGLALVALCTRARTEHCLQ